MLIAPTEPPALRAIGRTSMLPEKLGADVMWRSRGRWVGVQRKEVGDLLASVEDGRLGVQVSQMADLDVACLVVEGQLRWTMDGELMAGSWSPRRRWTRSAVTKILWGVAREGVLVDRSDDVAGTIEWVREFRDWVGRADAGKSWRKREGPQVMWGKATSRDFQRHLLMGLPGVGGELAERILDELGMPFGWRNEVDVDALMRVRGVGKKKAEALYRAMEPNERTGT